jgi:hypothetical protein
MYMNAAKPLMAASATPNTMRVCANPGAWNIFLNMRAEAKMREAFLERVRSAARASFRTKAQGGSGILE